MEYLDGVLTGKVIENGDYFRDYERIKAIQIFGIDEDQMK